MKKPNKPTPIGLALWGAELVQATVAQARMAEAAGFESIWLVDSQLICREAFVALAACAAATTTLKVSTGVTVPFIRHPSVTASGLATLAELSGGRAMAGVSTGHSALRNIGMKPARIAELEAFVRDVRRMLAGGEAAFENGTEGGLRWMEGRSAATPVHVAATGPKLTRAAAAMGDGVILLQGAAPDLLDTGLGLVGEGLAAARRARSEIETTAWVYVGLDVDPAKARDQVRARVAAILRMKEPARFEGEDRAAIESIRAAYDMLAHGDSMPAHAGLVPERMLDRYAIAGDGPAVRARIQALQADPRIDRIVVSPQIGAPGARITETFIEAFGGAVLAELSP